MGARVVGAAVDREFRVQKALAGLFSSPSRRVSSASLWLTRWRSASIAPIDHEPCTWESLVKSVADMPLMLADDGAHPTLLQHVDRHARVERAAV